MILRASSRGRGGCSLARGRDERWRGLIETLGGIGERFWSFYPYNERLGRELGRWRGENMGNIEGFDGETRLIRDF